MTKAMIKQVFPVKGISKTRKQVYGDLLALFGPNDPYRHYKALGAIGGARTSGFLKLQGNMLTSTR